MNTDISVLEKEIGYTFKNKELLLTALTHSSFYNENKRLRPCNERLEFLGDAVLSVISAEYLYECDTGNEGELSKVRAALVCEEALFEYAETLGLGNFLFLGRGEEAAGRTRKSTVADATEALLGAIYLDSGFEDAKKFILPYLKEKFRKINKVCDYKTVLQEIVQKSKGEKLSYEIVSESGPAHDRSFVCDVLINSNHISSGRGKSKKAAEQEAARAALELMGVKA